MSPAETTSASKTRRPPGRHGHNFPSISADGRYVAFESRARDLVADDTNRVIDIFVRDRQRGTTSRMNISSAERQVKRASSAPSISADGRYIAFVTSPATS